MLEIVIPNSEYKVTEHSQKYGDIELFDVYDELHDEVLTLLAIESSDNKKVELYKSLISSYASTLALGTLTRCFPALEAFRLRQWSLLPHSRPCRV